MTISRTLSAGLMSAVIGMGVGPQVAGSPPAVADNAARPPVETDIPMVDIPAGTFLMGAGAELSLRDWFNERPQHRTTISKPFRISAREVTVEEFRRFRADYVGKPGEAAVGISWDDAAAYAKWLAARSGRSFRLPTEAEWEYAARLAREDPKQYPAIRDMESGALEWTADWFGPYRPSPQIDPVGYDSGQLRVVRGGRMTGKPRKKDWVEIDYTRPEARLAFPPHFGPPADAPGSGGHHAIGFRLVEGPAPATRPFVAVPPVHALGVRQDLSTATTGPDPSKPYFRKRIYFPVPPDDSTGAAIDASGFDASFRHHNHSPGIAVMPNGDVLLTIFTSYDEYEAGMSIVAMRLRHGADEWDEPSTFVDLVGVGDVAPLMMTDGATARFFWGSPFLGNDNEVGPEGFPFQQMVSKDSGASWSPVMFPRMTGHFAGYTRQPINTAFRDQKGRLLLSSDGGRDPATGLGGGNDALLWASDDDGRTWYDPGGRTFGRHTTFVEAKDGRLLGFGGKNTDIGGYMPLATSRDGGKTYTMSPTPFPALGGNQRPSVLRLKSGRLLMIGDYVKKNNGATPLAGKRGAYAAVSSDDGANWRFKSLPGAGLHHDPDAAERMGGGTLGYSAMAQGPDGVVHVVTTMTHPSVTLSFNEAWLDAPEGEQSDEVAMTRPDVALVRNVRSFSERYADGRLKGQWSGGVGNNGAFTLDGAQKWFYANGRPMWQVNYRLGRKAGIEKLYAPDGKVRSQYDHRPDGTARWTTWWANGKVRSVSHWRGKFAEGEAVTYSANGTVLTRTRFQNGIAEGQPLILKR